MTPAPHLENSKSEHVYTKVYIYIHLNGNVQKSSLRYSIKNHVARERNKEKQT